MGGWGEPRGSNPAAVLASATRAYLDRPTTSNRERLAAALADWERAHRTILPPAGAYC